MSLRDWFQGGGGGERERARLREELGTPLDKEPDRSLDLGRGARDAVRHFAALDRQVQASTRELERLQRSVEKLVRGLGGPGGGGGGGAGGPLRPGATPSAGGGIFGASAWTLTGLGIGFGLVSTAIGAIGSIASAGSDLAKELHVFTQQLQSMSGGRATEGLGDYLHLGYTSIDTAQTRLALLRGVGANDLDTSGLERIQELERAVFSAERGLGIHQETTIGLLGALRRSGDPMDSGREGEERLKRILKDAVASGIELTRLPEYMAGIEGLLGAEQSQQAGPVSSETLSRMLALLGGPDAPGLQGMAGVRALAQLSMGIRAPGGGDAGRSIMLLALQRHGEASYTRTLAALDRGASDPENLRRLYEHMRDVYGLSGEPGSRGSEEALLRLSRMTGLGLSKLAGPGYAETGRIEEHSIVAALHRVTTGDDKTSEELARLNDQIEQALADPTERIEEHTREQAKYTERLVELGEESLKVEDDLKAVLADYVFPAVKSILSFLLGDEGNEDARREEIATAERLGLAAEKETARLERAEAELRAGAISGEAYKKIYASYERRMKALQQRYAELPEDVRTQKEVEYDPGGWLSRWGWEESYLRELFAGPPTIHNPFDNLEQFDLRAPIATEPAETTVPPGVGAVFDPRVRPAATGTPPPLPDFSRQTFAFEHDVRVFVDGPPASSQVTSRANPLGRGP